MSLRTVLKRDLRSTGASTILARRDLLPRVHNQWDLPELAWIPTRVARG
jgi:hypothetical protein